MLTPILTRAATAVALTASLLAMAPTSPSLAAEPAQRELHMSWDPEGHIFGCEAGELTALPGGLVNESFHYWVDSRGITRFQDAITLEDVVAVDAAGERYAVTGAQTIADKIVSWEEPLVGTETTHFVARQENGGIFGTVQVVVHFTADGTQHWLDFGDCAVS